MFIWKYQNIINEVFFWNINLEICWKLCSFCLCCVMLKKNVPWWVTNSCVSVYHYSVIKHLQSTVGELDYVLLGGLCGYVGQRHALLWDTSPSILRTPPLYSPHRSLPESQSSSDHKEKFCLSPVSTASSRIHPFSFIPIVSPAS